MPQKPKFTREEIVDAALKIAADKGIRALTSRALGAELGSSARPIFTVFNSMEEVLAEVRKAAFARFNEYSERVGEDIPAFKRIGVQMILFANEQPKLYRLLFMSEQPEAKSFDDMFANLGDPAVQSIDFIQRDYSLSHDDAMQLFKHVWIYTYGLGVLIATGMCSFTADETQKMLTCEFTSMMTHIKSQSGK